MVISMYLALGFCYDCYKINSGENVSGNQTDSSKSVLK